MSHIYELRKSRGMSQIQFGRQFGISQQTVSRIEKDPITIGTDVLVKISEYFSVTTDYVLDISDEKRNLFQEGRVNQKMEEYYDFILELEELTEGNKSFLKRMMRYLLETQKE